MTPIRGTDWLTGEPRLMRRQLSSHSCKGKRNCPTLYRLLVR